MKVLNKVVWYAGFIVSVFPVCWVFFYLWEDEDIWMEIPLAIGIIGTLSIAAAGKVGKINLAPPDPDTYPVPFIGLSAMGGSQIYALFSSGLIMLAMFIAGGRSAIAVIIALITVPIGFVMLLMAAFVIPYLAVVDGIFLLSVFLAKIIDRYEYDVNTRRFVCPGCGRKFYRPSYEVEGELIDGLCPTDKGVFHREMRSSKIPCFGSKSGRKRLPQCCPACREPVSTEEGKPFVLSVAGAPSSGKTSFILSAAGKAISSSGNGNASSAEFYFKKDATALSDYRAGRCDPTPVSFLSPRIVCFEPKHFPTKRLVYMCDVSGKFFSGGVETDLQPQYVYNDAIVFMMDPFCSDPAGTAFGAYVGFMEKYRLLNRLDASKQITVPFALVVSRSDKPGPFSGIGGAELREKLSEEGYFTLVNMIEKDFSTVSFFSCDASKEDGSANAVMKHLCGKEFGQFF